MRFFNQSQDDDENENQDDADRFFQDEEEFDEMMEEEFFDEASIYKEIKMAELTLVQANLNRRIMSMAIKTLEKSIFWRFLPHNTQLLMIESAYKLLSKLIAEE